MRRVLIADLEKRSYELLERVIEVRDLVQNLWINQDDLIYHVNLFINEFLQSQIQLEWLRYQLQQNKYGPFYKMASSFSAFFHLSYLPPPRLSRTAVKAKIRFEIDSTLMSHGFHTLTRLDVTLTKILDPDAQATWQRNIDSVLRSLKMVESDLQQLINDRISRSQKSYTQWFIAKSKPKALSHDIRTTQSLVEKVTKSHKQMLQVYGAVGTLKTKYSLFKSALSGIKRPKNLNTSPLPLTLIPGEGTASGSQESNGERLLLQPGWWKMPSNSMFSADITTRASLGYYTYNYYQLVPREVLAATRTALAQTCHAHFLDDSKDEALQFLCAVMNMAQTLSMRRGADSGASDGSPKSFHVMAAVYREALEEKEEKGMKHAIAWIEAI